MTETMTAQDRTTRLRLTLMGLASVVLFHLTPLAPPVGLLAAAPLYYLFVAHGATAGMMAMAGGALVTLVTSGPVVAYLYLVMAGGIAWFLSDGFLKQRPVSATVLRASGFPWGMVALALLGIALAAGESITALLTRWVDLTVGTMIASYQSTGVDEVTVAWLIENRSDVVNNFVAFFPSITFLVFFVATVGTVMAIRLFSVRYALGIHFPLSFAAFRAPDELVWGVIVGGFGGWLVEGPVGDLALNVLVIALAVFSLHGLALLHYTFVKWNTPVILRAFGYFLIVSQPLLLGVSGLFGIADLWIDFRKDTKRGDDDSSTPRD